MLRRIIIIAALVIVAAAFFVIKKLIDNRESAIREWLKYAVTLAEKALGSGTGQLKLRQVYEAFIEKFSFISKIISFDEFSELVDDALEWMKNQLESNSAVAALVNGTETEEEE